MKKVLLMTMMVMIAGLVSAQLTIKNDITTQDELFVGGDVTLDTGVVTGTGKISLIGNWTTNQTANAFGTDTTRVLFVGTSQQQIAGKGTNFPIVYINNTGGVKFANTISGPTWVQKRLQMVGGILDLNGHTVKFMPQALLQEQPTTYVTDTTNNGKLWYRGYVSNPSSLDVAGFRMQVTGSFSDSLTVERTHVRQQLTGPDTSSIYAVWSVTPDGAVSNAMVRAYYYDAEIPNDLLSYESGFGIYRYDGTTWVAEGSVVDAGSNYVEATLTSGFGQRLTVGASIVTSALPIELLYFKPECTGDGAIKILWATAAEINSNRFTIEKSPDGFNWQELITVPSLGNNTSYVVIDESPWSLTYYRLTQYDNDGQYETFDIKAKCCCSRDYIGMTVYPNPFTQDVYVKFSSTIADIYVTDVVGKIVYTKHIADNSGIEYSLPLQTLAQGTYFVNVHLPDGQWLSEKIIKNTD